MTVSALLPPKLYTKVLFQHVDEALESATDKNLESKVESTARYVFRFLIGHFVLFYAAMGSLAYNTLTGAMRVVCYFKEGDIEKKGNYKQTATLHFQYALMETVAVFATYINMIHHIFTLFYVFTPIKIREGYIQLEQSVEEAWKSLSSKADIMETLKKGLNP